jgi:hypothetical protein
MLHLYNNVFLITLLINAVAMDDGLRHWRLGFRQYSFYHITRVLQNHTFGVFQCSLLFQYAIFPFDFHLQVNWTTQKSPSNFSPLYGGFDTAYLWRT